jgi:predicted Zn-ribbon and HTH transcriptional regulator
MRGSPSTPIQQQHPPEASTVSDACSVSNDPMRVIAVIDDPRVIEKILRHLGARLALRPQAGAPGACPKAGPVVLVQAGAQEANLSKQIYR